MRDVVTSPDRRSMYERDGDWTADTLAARVAKWAAQRPGDVAVVDGEGSHTYDQLGADASRVAGFLGERGVMPGEVVSMQLPNRYEAVVLAVAVQSLGAVINPLLPNYRAKELAHVFETAAPRVVVTPARVPRLRPLRARR